MLLICNADDLGASPQVNEAIFEQVEAGRVRSATILANGPAFEEAVRVARGYGQCSFGVHLNLTEYEPITDLAPLRKYLQCGFLHRGLRTRPFFNFRQLLAIRAEFAAQIRRVQQSGLRISHLDSHMHIHTRPDLLPIVKSLQKEFRIERVRCRLNLYPLDQPPRVLMRVWIPICNRLLRCFPRTKTTDYMGRLSVFVRYVEAGRALAGRSVEVMVHPGRADPDCEAENRLLSSSRWQLLTANFRLGNFWDL